MNLRNANNLRSIIVQKKLRVADPNSPAPRSLRGGDVLTRQFDATLIGLGFKLSGELFRRLSDTYQPVLLKVAQITLEAVAEMLGDHVRHNVYFKDFPANVPSTEVFWANCIAQAIAGGNWKFAMGGDINLLELPTYGRYMHSYAEMVAHHEKLEPGLGSLKILRLGKELADEASDLFKELASSKVPLSGEDLSVLREISSAIDVHPRDVPVRENLAVINAAFVRRGKVPYAKTITDVLRLACELSGGDVTLAKPTKFISFPRAQRRLLMAVLDIVASDGEDITEVNHLRERWKRLGKAIHPNDPKFARFHSAISVFNQASHNMDASTMFHVNAFMRDGLSALAALELVDSPGLLARNIEWLLGGASTEDSQIAVADSFATVVSKISGRVLLSLLEHLLNARQSKTRVFVNRSGKAWVTPETRKALPVKITLRLHVIIVRELQRRLKGNTLPVIIGMGMHGVALPLSEKTQLSGYNAMPRGTVATISSDVLRFFIYWKETAARTDYDLSVLLLDENLKQLDALSFRNILSDFGVHSGDITSAPEGASEFIDIKLPEALKRGVRYIIPTVNKFAGEDFKTVAECFFGYMERVSVARVRRQRQFGSLTEFIPDGLPYEPTTVKTKADMRGDGNIALPLAFCLTNDGEWQVKWLNIFLKGLKWGNCVESNRMSTALLAKGILDRKYLTVTDLVGMMPPNSHRGNDGGVMYIGNDAPESLPEGSQIVTLSELKGLIPA